MAESEGFEPPEDFSSTVFKTAAFSRSASSPKIVTFNLRVDYLSRLRPKRRFPPRYFGHPALHPYGAISLCSMF